MILRVYRLAALPLIVLPIAYLNACSSDDSSATSPMNAGGDATMPDGSMTDAAVDAGYQPPGVTAANVTPTVIAGSMVVDAQHCHDCHDSDAGVLAGGFGTGLNYDLPSGSMIKIFPANLTSDPMTGLGEPDAGGWSDDEITRAVRTGVDDQCLTLCTAMPRFTEQKLPDSDLTNLLVYLHALSPVVNDVTMQGCPSLTPATGAGGSPAVDAGCAGDAGETDAATDASDAGIADASDSG